MSTDCVRHNGPLADGSSNIEAGIPVGTIFGIYPCIAGPLERQDAAGNVEDGASDIGEGDKGAWEVDEADRVEVPSPTPDP